MLESSAKLVAEDVLFEVSGCCTLVGIQDIGAVRPRNRLEAPAPSYAEDPGGHGGFELEGPGAAPYHEHRVVQDFVDQMRPPRPLLEEPSHPRAVAPIQRLERGDVAACNPPDQNGIIRGVASSSWSGGTRLVTFG